MEMERKWNGNKKEMDWKKRPTIILRIEFEN